MKYFRNPENGEVFAYESDGSQDYLIEPSFLEMSQDEIEAHLAPKIDFKAVEDAWREEEMLVIADQLLRIEDEDPNALQGTERDWRDYRIKLRTWIAGAEYFPDKEYRPSRP